MSRTQHGRTSLTHGWLGYLLLMLGSFVAGTSSAEAQFTGPALTVPSQAVQPQVPTTDLAILQPQLHDLVIIQGDVLSVRIFGQATDFATAVRVGVDGLVQLPLIGAVPIAGLTVERAANLIAGKLLAAGMYVDPQVTIQVVETPSQFATVSGEVHAIVPIAGQRRLLDVMAVAGGLPVTSSHLVNVIRPGLGKPIVVDLGTDPSRAAETNIAILPGDTILISRVGVVYVVGAFKVQGAIPLVQNSPLTLVQATSLSGGQGYEGRFEDLRIIRTMGLERKVVKVDIKRILRGKDPDPVLQADDIVFLPTNSVKAALKNGGIGTLIAIADLAIIVLRR